MSKGSFTMQKSWTRSPSRRGFGVWHGHSARPILIAYGSLIRRRVHVLLLPDAGVWVGAQTKFFPPTRQKRVGFTFIRSLGLG